MDCLGKQAQAINMADHVDDHTDHMIQVTSRSRMYAYKYVITNQAGEERRLYLRSFHRPTTKPQTMSEGVPVASLYYSDSPWSCAGELMSFGLLLSIDRFFSALALITL